ncbi:MAG: DUF3108 domain-containing protein [Arenicellales bacterium]
MSKVARITVLIAAMTMVCMVAGRAEAMNAFKARYEATYGIFPLGEYRLTFDRLPAGRYRYESDSDPSGLVRLFSDKRVVERSEGRWTPDGPRPERYERRVHSDDGWQTDVIVLGNRPRVITPEGEHRIDPPPGALDPAGLLLQIIHDFRRGHLDGEYTLVDEHGKSRHYRTRDMGTASVEVMGRKWQARHMRRAGGDPSRGLDVYLVRDLGGLPARIDYVAKGRRFKMYLEDLQGIPIPVKHAPGKPRD